MENIEEEQARLQLEQKLVKDLQNMRDALTSLSLMLHDLEFAVIPKEADSAFELTANLTARAQCH